MWMTELRKTERRTMAGFFPGWTLDALGMRVYSFVIPTLLAGWHISPTGAGMLGTVTLLASAMGGWLSGIAADRYGRAAVLQATILWYALFTFASGFTQNYEQLFICPGCVSRLRSVAARGEAALPGAKLKERSGHKCSATAHASDRFSATASRGIMT
ncbi:MFS transporter [Paraburkholderia xenovorans]